MLPSALWLLCLAAAGVTAQDSSSGSSGSSSSSSTTSRSSSSTNDNSDEQTSLSFTNSFSTITGEFTTSAFTGSEYTYLSPTGQSTVQTLTTTLTTNGTVATITSTSTSTQNSQITATTKSVSLTEIGGISSNSTATNTRNGTASSTTSSARPTNTVPCNGFPEFCNRKYSNITNVVAHNSAFVVKNNAASNQFLPITDQLNDGVRMLQGEVHWVNDTLWNCHTSCQLLNGGTWQSELETAKDWLDAHPYDVLSFLIVNSDFTKVENFVPAITNAGLLPYVYEPSYVPQYRDQWPTLGEMILKGQRMVFFMDYNADQAKVPYILDEFTHIWETPFSPTNQSFPCTQQRPPGLSEEDARDRYMYLANQNLNTRVDLSSIGIDTGSTEILIPNTAELNITNGLANQFGRAGATLANCTADWGRPPTFLLVDYYNIGSPMEGSIFHVAAEANGVTYTLDCCGKIQSAAPILRASFVGLAVALIVTAFLACAMKGVSRQVHRGRKRVTLDFLAIKHHRQMIAVKGLATGIRASPFVTFDILGRTLHMASGSLKRASTTDRNISPPPPKRKVTATTTNKAVSNFFKPASEKEPEKIKFQVLHDTLLVGRYEDAASRARPKPVKVAAFDLDDTLIKTKSGNVFARGADDWQWWHARIPGKLKQLDADGYAVILVSNQSGISLRSDKGSDKKSLSNFKEKLSAVFKALELPITIYAATEKDLFRKPRTGMWEQMLRDYGLDDTADVDRENSIFVGDAAGREGDKATKVRKDHSCSDRDFAANVGIPFQTPEEYWLGEDPKPFIRAFEPKEHLQTTLDSQTDSDPIVFTKKNVLEIVLFCGSPGSGKSTFFWTHLEPLGYERVNQDQLKTRDKCMKVATLAIEEDKKSVAVDNTNADIETRAAWVGLAAKLKVPIRLVHFTASAKLCEHNDTVRALSEGKMNPEKRQLLPTMAFSGFASRYREPKVEEGFQDITKVDFVFRGPAEEKALWSRYWIS